MSPCPRLNNREHMESTGSHQTFVYRRYGPGSVIQQGETRASRMVKRPVWIGVSSSYPCECAIRSPSPRTMSSVTGMSSGFQEGLTTPIPSRIRCRTGCASGSGVLSCDHMRGCRILSVSTGLLDTGSVTKNPVPPVFTAGPSLAQSSGSAGSTEAP